MSLFFLGDPDADRIQEMLDEGRIERATLVFMDFASKPIRLTDLPRGFTDRQGGHRWESLGALAALDPVQQSSDLTAFREMRLAIPDALLDSEEHREFDAFALVGDAADYAGRDVITYLQYFDSEPDEWGRRVPLGSPKLVDHGVMSEIEANADVGFAQLTLTQEALTVRGTRPEHEFLTDQSQRLLHPDDLGLQFVAEVAQKEIKLFEA